MKEVNTYLNFYINLRYTYKRNVGTLEILNLRAVTAEVLILSLATFKRVFNLAPTASHLACKRWQSTHSFV